MKKLSILLALVTVFLFSMELKSEDLKTTLKNSINANSKISDKVKSFAIDKLLPLCSDKTLFDETAKQNGKNMSLADIKKIDGEWQSAEEPTPYIKEKLANACATKLKKLLSAYPAVLEAFVMDNQGGVVGETNLTSDYWQGDEEKWTNSYNGGKGGIDAGAIKLDKSVNTSIQQVSLPLFMGDKIIGAITFGIKVDKL